MGTKFLFSGTGTRGDLLPMLGLAAELQRRGHACHVLGNDAVDAWARQMGVPFTPIAPAQTNNLTSVEQNFGRYVFASYEPTFEFMRGELRRGSSLVVVNPENYAASTLMAESHGLPLCRFTLAPYRIFSLEAPYYPHGQRLLGPLRQTFRRYVLPALLERRYTQPYIVARMNEFRAALSLPALSNLRSLDRLVTHQVCLFPEWYCSRASDWPRQLDCVGFPLTPPSEGLPEEVSRWLERHPAPIVFTPGTGVTDVTRFFDVARQCCVVLERPGLFLSPNFDPTGLDAQGRLLHWDYLELASVLPHAALLVHHGGIGTTARALESGIPQIISPQAFDQPDNAHRIARLGAGLVIERADFSCESLAHAARTLLSSAGAQCIVRDLSRRVREQSGVAGFADVVERRFIASVERAAARTAA